MDEPSPEPEFRRDSAGDVWIEIGSDRWRWFRESELGRVFPHGMVRTRGELEDQFGPTSRSDTEGADLP